MPSQGSDAAKGALSGAGTGATIGSAFGPWGTAIGGAAGLIGGGLAGYFGGSGDEQADAQARQLAILQENAQILNNAITRGHLKEGHQSALEAQLGLMSPYQSAMGNVYGDLAPDYASTYEDALGLMPNMPGPADLLPEQPATDFADRPDPSTFNPTGLASNTYDPSAGADPFAIDFSATPSASGDGGYANVTPGGLVMAGNNSDGNMATFYPSDLNGPPQVGSADNPYTPTGVDVNPVGRDQVFTDERKGQTSGGITDFTTQPSTPTPSVGSAATSNRDFMARLWG